MSSADNHNAAHNPNYGHKKAPPFRLWEPPTELLEDCIHGINLSLFQPEAEKSDGSGQDRERQVKQEDFVSFASRQACIMVKRDLVTGNRLLRCLLFRLPIDVRIKIYGYLFPHNDEPVKLEDGRFMPRESLAILRTCHAIYHEASIAFFYSLNYRNIVFSNYGEDCFDNFNRGTSILPRCINRAYDAHLEYPCGTNKLDGERELKTLTLEVGSSDENLACYKRWRFTDFLLTSKFTEGPLKVYSLNVVAAPTWKVSGFNEKDLVQALFTGALDIYGDITFKGFNADEGGEILRLLVDMDMLLLR